MESATSIAKEVTGIVSESKSGIFIIPKTTDTGKLKDEQRQKQAGHLLATIDKAYNEDDLRELCMFWNLDYESISGANKRAKIVSLIGYFYRRNTMRVFVEFLEGDRPKWNWRFEETSTRVEKDEGK